MATGEALTRDHGKVVINYLVKARNVFLILYEIIFSSIPFHIWNEFDNGFMSKKITTEYKQTVKLTDNEIDLLQGRMSYAILDVIEHMNACKMSEEEIMKLILRDVQQIVDIHFEETHREISKLQAEEYGVM